MHNAKSNLHRISKVFLIITVFTAIFTTELFSPVFSVNAGAYAAQKVYDYGELLTDREEARLEEQLRTASESCGHDIIVYTVHSLEGEDAERRSERAADSINAGDSGILYLVAIDSSDYNIFTFGKMNKIMRSSDRDRLGEELAPYLTAGDYYGAFSEFGKRSRAAAEKGETFVFFPALLAGAIVALIVVLVMKSGMKTTRPEITAGNYVKNGSFKVTVSRDIYLYTSVSRVKIQQGSSGGHSGGHTGGHSSGKF